MRRQGLLIFGLSGQSAFMDVPHFHLPEETIHATSLFFEPGGKGYNQAVAAARMGADVTFVSAIGEDVDGDACKQRLIEERIRAHLFRKREAHTAYAFILTDSAGENHVTVYPGASLTRKDVLSHSELFERACLLLLTPEIPHEAFNEAFTLAKKYGVRTIINPAPFTPWIIEYAREAWCLTPNQIEAQDLLGIDETDDLASALKDSHYERMVVTLGASGALCLENGTVTPLPTQKVAAKDSTGAGDALNGALCAMLLQGATLVDAARTGVQAATLSVTRQHVLDAMPYAFELET